VVTLLLISIFKQLRDSKWRQGLSFSTNQKQSSVGSVSR
jgi:hypothetical protein